MLCDKRTLIINNKPFNQKRITKLSKDFLNRKFFGSAQAHIEVPNELYDKFNEMAPLPTVIYPRK